MEDKKLLFFDIDGTLAMPGQSPGRDTVKAIQKARENGHFAFISTGRTLSDVPKEVMEIGFDGGIYSSGGKVMVEDKVLSEKVLQKEQAEMIRSFFDDHNMFYTLECGTENYRNQQSMERLLKNDISEASSELRRMFAEDRTKSVTEYQGEPVYKVSFLCKNRQQIQEIRTYFGDALKVVVFGNLMPDYPVVAGEVSDFDINKGIAVEEICKHYGKSVKDTIAFGDSMNDAEMLMTAGIGVAMDNADLEVKKLANQICPSCYEDGVAKALSQFRIV